jgi:hypothetical protein
MPALIAFLGTLGASLIAKLVEFFTKKVLFRIGMLTLFIAMFSAFIAGLYSAIGSISVSFPDSWQTYVDFLLPSNFATCATIIVSTKVSVWFWNWTKWGFEKLAFGE